MSSRGLSKITVADTFISEIFVEKLLRDKNCAG